MDPLTALSLAGTIIQVIDFGTKVLHGSRSLYNSASGALDVNAELELITRDLTVLSKKLWRPLSAANATNSDPNGHEYDSLRELCDGCKSVADELLVALEDLKMDGSQNNKAWKSLRYAIKSIFSQKEIDSLNDRLAAFRRALDTHILADLKNASTMMSIQQSRRFDELDRRTQDILVALLDRQDRQDSLTKDLHAQTMAVAQMLNRTELIVTARGGVGRSVVIQALGTPRLLAQAKEYCAIPEEVDQVDRARSEEDRIKLAVQKNILQWFYFESIRRRQEDVVEAHGATFAWFLRPSFTPTGNASSSSPKSANFVDWLEKGRGIYWINGKAGSGKSTLMRYICESEVMKNAVRTWAGSQALCISTFFFWNGGSRDQRSQVSLLRAILYDVLSSHPALIPIVMPGIWAKSYNEAVLDSLLARDVRFSLKFLIETFRHLIRQKTVVLKICLFIDGLDEYEGEPADLIDLLADIPMSDNIKACISSRPLVAYEQAFSPFSTIRLQDLNYGDIKLYVDDKLNSNHLFRQLALQEHEKAPALVHEIVTKSDGVFLWVVLVVRSILVGLGNRDEIEDLQRRLEELPSDLEKLFDNMLNQRIEPFYQKKAAGLFQIFRISTQVNNRLESHGDNQWPLTLLALSFADDNDPEYFLKERIAPLPQSTKVSRCETMEDRLKTRCAGLLEVRGPGADSYRAISGVEVAKSTVVVQYLHRTVKDYLQQPDVWSAIIAKTEGMEFDPHISMLKSCIVQIKTSDFTTAALPDELWRCVALALEHARHAELDENIAYIPLLDHLDSVMKSLIGNKYPGHWSRYYKEQHERPFEWDDNFSALAVEYGLCNYLDYKFRQLDEKACDKSGRPLLDYAISNNSNQQRYPVSAKVVALLLKHGSKPNLSYKGTTPFENFLDFSYSLQFLGSQRRKPRRTAILDVLSLFKSFIEYGADLRTTFQESGTKQPISFLIDDMFMRWYPEESADLVALLRRPENIQLKKQIRSKKSRHLIDLFRKLGNVEG